MTNTLIQDAGIAPLQAPSLDERLQLLSNYDRLSSQYIFTDIQKAQKYLAEQKKLLDEFEQPDFALKYNWNTALVENQLYNYTLSEQHFKSAIELLEERGDLTQLVEAYIDFAGTLHNLDKGDLVKLHLDGAAKYLRNYPDTRLMARLICREGYMHLKNSNLTKAIQSFLEAEIRMASLGKMMEIKDYYFLTLIKTGLAGIYVQMQEPEKSIEAYRQVLDLCESKNMRYRLSWNHLYVGNGYMAVGDNEKAIRYFSTAIRVIDDVNQQARAMAYAHMGYCSYRLGQYEKALDYLTKAQPLFKDKKEKNLSNVEWWRAKVFIALERQKKSIKHLYKALDYARQAADYKQISGIVKDITNWHEDKGMYKDAFEYQKYYEQAIERYLQEVKETEIKELEIKYEAERREKEAEMFKLQATGLQLRALQAQMNPHFMHNALNSVQSFINTGDSEKAANYLAQFAHLMRQCLYNSDMEIISLEQEVDFLRQYLEINEKLRFEDKLRYSIEVDEDIEDDICGVPTMIVQPYVENALEHGIRSKKNGLGIVKVSYTLYDDDNILCIIQDNGIGRERARLNQESDPARKGHKSLGTKITKERLEILQKSKDKKKKVVKIIDLKDEQTGAPLGTRVEILIPIFDIQMK